jgi:hypothetical protein
MAVPNAATVAALADFDAVLNRIGINQPQCDAIIEASRCHNIAMIGLLTADQISKMCKHIENQPVNPLVIMTVQEQLLLSLRYWVAGRQCLQQMVIIKHK